LVATDDDGIVDHCKENGIPFVITSKECFTGSDCVCEVVQENHANIYLNVQGDEPIINPTDIKKVMDSRKGNKGNVVNAMCSIKDEMDYRNPNVPKVVS